MTHGTILRQIELDILFSMNAGLFALVVLLFLAAEAFKVVVPSDFKVQIYSKGGKQPGFSGMDGAFFS